MKFFDSESDAVFLSQCWSFPRSIVFPKAEVPKGKLEDEGGADASAVSKVSRHCGYEQGRIDSSETENS